MKRGWWLGIWIWSFPVLMLAQGIGFFGGVSIPDNNVGDVFPSRVPETGSEIKDLIEQGLSVGYHAQLRYWLRLSDEIQFTATGGLHRFPDLTTALLDPMGNQIGELRTVLNIVPVGFGVEYTIFRKILGIFVYAEALYTYTFTNTEIALDIEGAPPVLPIDTEPTYNRVGAGGGIGVDLNVKLFIVDVRLGVWASNLIGRSSDEPVKSIVSLSAGLAFGK